MIIRDPKLRERVSVRSRECLGLACYWPRVDPGPFLQGRGYRPSEGTGQWLCGTREARGCPDKVTAKEAKL